MPTRILRSLSNFAPAILLPTLSSARPLLSLIWDKIRPYSHWLFFATFSIRYSRVLMNIIGRHMYRPIQIPSNPTYHASDVTVVVPTTELNSTVFHDVVESIAKHPVHKIIIVAAGAEAFEDIEPFKSKFADPRILVLHHQHADRRRQTAHALKYVDTSLLILQDNHTYWTPSDKFLPSLIAPFEDPATGGVSPVIDGRHHHHPSLSWRGFWNFLGMTYLVRRTMDYCGTYGIDGGISTLSGRFGIFRKEIYTSKEYLHGYLNEYIFFGTVGPLNVDDDKYHTRWLIKHDWNIVLQAGPETTMTSELGEWPKFMEQILRWMRTTWRSNFCQLVLEPHARAWQRYPYTLTTLLLWFFRLSLVQEGFMFYWLWEALKQGNRAGWYKIAAPSLTCWILGLKFLKISGHFMKYPKDLVYFPSYLLFGYWCSLVKLWAMLTWWVISWGTATSSNEADEANECEELEKEIALTIPDEREDLRRLSRESDSLRQRKIV